MRKKYGEVIGFPADCSDEKLIKDLPEAINRILGTIENAAKENNGIIDIRSFQFVYHYHDEYDGPLGIEYLGHMCKATIGVKCDIEFPEEQDGQTEKEKAAQS